MEHLLFLVHRIPYPPDKGDKIRSWHLLKHLCQRYRVHLATFVDAEEDWKYVDTVKRCCDTTFFANLSPRVARLRSLTGLLRSAPMTLAYYENASLHRWISDLKNLHPIARILVFSSAMAQFVPRDDHARCVIDFVDVDSDKWAQYGQKKPWPLSMLYRWEAKQLLRYEKSIAIRFARSLFVSAEEAALFCALVPEASTRIGHFNNGVDTDYFCSTQVTSNPYSPGNAVIVFTGAMDYWPNVDAVSWFANSVFPSIRQRLPHAVFYIVGSKPTGQVLNLANIAGVYVTGRVDDIRPYLEHASVAVAPLRIARGIQNKVLEAMAMSRTIVVSQEALEGIAALTGKELIMAGDAAAFEDSICSALTNPDPAIGLAARTLVQSRYGWTANLAVVDDCLQASGSSVTRGLPV